MEQAYSSIVESQIKSRLNSKEGLKHLLDKYKGYTVVEALLNEKFSMYKTF